MAFKIIASQCTQCSACEFECPTGAIKFKGETYDRSEQVHRVRGIFRDPTMRGRLSGAEDLRSSLIPSRQENPAATLGP